MAEEPGRAPLRADLHIHTSASDGDLAPADLARTAREGGLDLIAISDHDTAAGITEAIDAAPAGLTIIPAIEISASLGDRELHILGYGIDHLAVAMREYQRRARTAREERMEAMIAALADLGVPVSLSAVRAHAADSRSIGRPHLARALLDAGHVRSFGNAFERYIGDDGPAYVPTRLLDVPAAIRLIHAVGGLAVWAHPRRDTFDAEIRGLADHGLDGVEAYRPRTGPTDLNVMRSAADGFGLFLTGGSDWHGDWHGPLGSFHIGRAELGEFLERLGL